MPLEDSTISRASRTSFSSDDAALASSEFSFASNCSAIALIATSYCRSVPLATLSFGPEFGAEKLVLATGHNPAGFLAGIGQRLQEILPVNIIHENVLAPVSPVP